MLCEKKAHVPGTKIVLLRHLVVKVYECVNDIHPDYLSPLFVEKESPYGFRDNSTLSRPVIKFAQPAWIKIFQRLWCQNMECSLAERQISYFLIGIQKFMMTSSNGSFLPALLVLCAGNSPVTGEFPSQRASNADFDFSLMWVHINC